MDTTMFLFLLSAFGVLSGLVTEAVKKIVSDKENLSYNLIALIVSFIVGAGGTALYYQLTAMPFTLNNVIYLVLMGFASALVSTTGYDKVKQTLDQIFVK